jgi:hypothetical protein
LPCVHNLCLLGTRLHNWITWSIFYLRYFIYHFCDFLNLFQYTVV